MIISIVVASCHSLPMTWYFNNEGAAEGPLDEPTILDLVQSQKLSAKTLVWHNGLELWQEAGTVSPGWWQPAEQKEDKKTSASATSKSPARRSPVPLAPSDESPKKKSGGLLRRLFGKKS